MPAHHDPVSSAQCAAILGNTHRSHHLRLRILYSLSVVFSRPGTHQTQENEGAWAGWKLGDSCWGDAAGSLLCAVPVCTEHVWVRWIMDGWILVRGLMGETGGLKSHASHSSAPLPSPPCHAFSQFVLLKLIKKCFWHGSLCNRIVPVYHLSPNGHDEITRQIVELSRSGGINNPGRANIAFEFFRSPCSHFPGACTAPSHQNSSPDSATYVEKKSSHFSP